MEVLREFFAHPDRIGGIQAVSAQSLATGKSAELAREELARNRTGRDVHSMEDPFYPPRLKEIYDPPLVLYVRGNVEVLTMTGIAMVGTRHPTSYGSGWLSAWDVILRRRDW